MNLQKDKTIAEITSRLKSSKKHNRVVKAEGTWGSFARMLATHICENLNKSVFYICPHIDDADNAADDLKTFGAKNIQTLPAWEGTEDPEDATDEIRAQRTNIALKLLSKNPNSIITAPVQAICQPMPKIENLLKTSLSLKTQKNLSPKQVKQWLIKNKFENVDRIDLPGQFAHRGGIIDIYPSLTNGKNPPDKKIPKNSITPDSNNPVRIEFFGDTIESIRTINLDTQRSTRQIKSINIISTASSAKHTQKELFINTLPENTITILEEPNGIQEVAKVFLQRIEHPRKLYNWRNIFNALKKFRQLHICRFARSNTEDSLKLKVKSIQKYQQNASPLWTGHQHALQELVNKAKENKNVSFYCQSPAQTKRLTEIILQNNKSVPENFNMKLGYIHQGFAVESLKTIIMSHHELFGQYTLKRKQRPIRPSAPVDTLSDLVPGDYVVHLSYGIGKFREIKTIKEKGRKSEYLSIEYADGVTMQVSVQNINLVQKYIGTSPKRPKLSKIGAKKWKKQKEKAESAVKDLAAEFLQIQAERQAKGGIVFSQDGQWQNEFEESFPYTETKDQIIASEQIKTDMQKPVAMDRLLCGDVGYGKTELAMRAAFKAVESGKQVAILVPTTVLAVQHFRTFTDRFADFPISIEVLNRFKTKTQAKKIIKKTKQAKVDILIGTHRILSPDIGFKNLGLLIIDEEQRFGVKHKERLKKLRYNVDVLTMTATPIPRTLNMALLGLRDISSLGIPPLDRRSIVTTVNTYNKNLIRKTIIRELNRQGQIFFLHNRVKTIEKKAKEIQKLVPDAKVVIAHGQLPKKNLEKTMIDFILARIDVLVCSTIIESGLDIPNANTIFINDADRFGLAELHQLRGRVGRYKHRAYAYMLMPKSRPISPVAAKRLKAIEEYSHLGAGFRIALRDLEIRGAGNILGLEQSGHIQAVGYQMYCELLTNAVKKIKKMPIQKTPDTTIDLGFATYIPKNYIPSDKNRMEVYRKIATAKIADDIKQIETELDDVFGTIPKEVKFMLKLAQLKIKAAKHNIRSITATGTNLLFSFNKKASPKTESLMEKTDGKLEIIDQKTLYLKPHKNHLEPQTLINILHKILNSNSKQK